MKKILLILLLVCVSRFACLAQNSTYYIGFAGEAGFATGYSSRFYNSVQGVNTTLLMPSDIKNLQFMVSAGCDNFDAIKPYTIIRRDTTGIPDAVFLPLEIGAKYYRNNFFIQGEIGSSIASTTAYPGTRVGLLYSPVIGYTLPAFYADVIDISVGYQSRLSSAGNANNLFLRFSYMFGL